MDNPFLRETCTAFFKNRYFRARFSVRGIIVLAMRRFLGTIIAAVCLLGGCSKGAAGLYENAPGHADAEADAPALREYTAIVTVKRDASGRIGLQLDDETLLYPSNYTEPFTRQCRIICGLSWWEGSKQCTLQWMDYLQEGPVQGSSAQEGDGVDIVEDWMTSVEDGYLTLHYSTFWGDGSIAHTLFLVSGENPDDPYEVRLIHLNNGDAALEEGDALIYFDLAGLPPTGDSGQPLTLKWKNGAGQMVSKAFLFRSRP